MNKLCAVGRRFNSTLTMCINLTDYGQGWIKLNIPMENRDKILMELDIELEAYKSSPQWREYLGNKITDWLKYITDPDKYK